MITFSKDGAREQLKALLRTASFVRLFVNDVDVSAQSDVSALNEAEGSAYVAQPIAAASWTLDLLGAKWRAQSPEYVWRFSGKERYMVRGWYVTNAAGQLLWSDKFDEPFEVLRDGDELGVTMVIDA